jgi:hypothetical protein
MKNVYNSGGVEPEIEGAYSFYEGFDAWVNVSVFYRNGNAVGIDEPTSIQIYPLSAGVSIIFFF